MRVVVTVARTKRAGPAVPLSAISVARNGREGVTVLRDGRQHFVPVSVTFSGDGKAQVTTEERGALRIGDEVVIGIALEAS